jgi:hypothetical protein
MRNATIISYPTAENVFCECDELRIVELPDCNYADPCCYPNAPDLVFCRRHNRDCQDCGEAGKEED